MKGNPTGMGASQSDRGADTPLESTLAPRTDWTFDWVFYLRPKGAFDHLLDEIVAAALKKEKMGSEKSESNMTRKSGLPR